VVWDANPQTLLNNIQGALNSMFGAGNTTVRLTATNQYEITFGGTLAGNDVQQLGALTANLISGGSASTPLATIKDGGSEVQRLSFSGNFAGNFQLVQAGNAVSPVVNYSSTAAVLQGNLQAAVNLMFGAGNATVSTVANPPAGTTLFNVTFTGTLANRDV